jgi:oligopeptide/dipeptide ABC transporter ATP-binding protein
VTPPVLQVVDLRVGFDTEAGTVVAVDGVSFDLCRGETLAMVGESGCGKTVTALSILRLLQSPPARLLGGQVLYDGRDLLRIPESDLRKVRGRRIAMVFQEPMSALNPVFPVGEQIAEAVRVHFGATRREAERRAVEVMAQVGIPAPEERLRAYPHQLSGGLRQRVMIAIALSCRPDVLIADEPTTALDVTIQAQILDLLSSLCRDLGLALLLITHDLGVVAEVADRVVVLYAGEVVEQAEPVALFRGPRHPYTAGLLASLPTATAERSQRLAAIPGTVPDPRAWPPGCRFADRCPRAQDDCRARSPSLAGEAHRYRCYHPLGP